MPPKITKVRWSAQNVPWGLSFNEKTGTFSGTPEDVGEYTVPVTVETNYGKDTKNIKVTVAEPVYTLYAIGTQAQEWSINSGYISPKPDSYGFYAMSGARHVWKLSEWYGGFRVFPYDFTKEKVNVYYPFGLLNTNSYRADGFGLFCYKWEASVIGTALAPNVCTSDITGILSAYVSDIPDTNYRSYIYTFATISAENEMTLTHFLLAYDKTKTTQSPTWYHIENIEVTSLPVLDVVDILYSDNGSTIGWLSEDGTEYNYVVYSIYKNVNKQGVIYFTAEASVKTVNIGYKAIKIFNTQFIPNADFHFLSENKLLDNNSDNFKHGTIKDAWINGNEAYVQTTSNQLYEYVASTKTWKLLGVYDVKKLRFPNTVKMMRVTPLMEYEAPDKNHMFLLTNDGKLYHKGSSVEGIFTEAHNTLTHVFPSLMFKDFAFGGEINAAGSTLVVLRE